MELPILTNVDAKQVFHRDRDRDRDHLASPSSIQGGALRTFPVHADVESVELLLTTDESPLNARVELLHGPNNNKQVVELYSENGQALPFHGVIECPRGGSIVRVVNTAPVEFPLTCSIVPHVVCE